MDSKLFMHDQISKKKKNAEKSQKILTSRRSPSSSPYHLYGQFSGIDCSLRGLNGNHERSTPRRSETSGIAERAVRRVEEGTSSVLVQSGLQVSRWAEAMHGVLLVTPKCARPTGRWPDASQTSVQFTSRWADHSIWSMISLLSNIIKRPRPSAHQFGTKVLPGILIGYALNAGGKLDWSFFVVDTKNMQTIPHLKFMYKGSNLKKWNFSREQWRCIPMQNGRSLTRGTAIIYHYLKSERRLQARPEIQIRMLKFDKDFWSIIRNCLNWKRVPRRTKLLVPKDDFPIPLNYTCRETNENEHWCTSWGNHRWLLWVLMETRHCLNPGSVWQDSNHSTKIHQKDTRGCKANWRRNRSPQDLNTCGQKIGQECRTFSAQSRK